MIVLLRFIGVMNAAVWFGATVLFAIGVTPATYSADMQHLLNAIGVAGEQSFLSYSDIFHKVYWERFISLQIWCGGVALVHQVAEWLYLGRRLQRITFYLLLALLSLALFNGLVVQPNLKRLHEVEFAYELSPQGRPKVLKTPSSDSERLKAGRSFRIWYLVGTRLNWLSLLGLGALAWRVANPVESAHFLPTSKFRS